MTPSRVWPVFPVSECFPASFSGVRTSDPRLPTAEWAGICPLAQSRASMPLRSFPHSFRFPTLEARRCGSQGLRSARARR